MTSAILVLAGFVLGTVPPIPSVSVHAPFVQEVPTVFTQAAGLPGPNAQAITLSDTVGPVVSTPHGLARFDGKAWQAISPGPGFDATILRSIGKSVWAAGGPHLARLDAAGWTAFKPLKGGQITDIVPWNGAVLVCTTHGLAKVNHGAIEFLPAQVHPIETLVPFKGTIPTLENHVPVVGLALAGGRLYALRGNPSDGACALAPLYPSDATHSWCPSGGRALASAGTQAWYGDKNGVAILEAGSWKLYTGKDGLPYDHFTCAASSKPGVIWFGTEWGAIRFDGKHWEYRAGRHWLPGDHVNGIAVAPDGTAWIATSKGVSRIERETMTLAKKAAIFEKIIDERHTRMGYVTRCLFKKPGDVSTAYITPTDNDGLNTAMYGAAEAFRYAATKDPVAKARAERSFKAMKFLVDVTGIPGFPARAVLPTTWPVDPNIKMGEAFNKERQKTDPLWKNILPRWPKSADGKYWWKCDTSSDEISGHYFFYGVYYDLVAKTPEEKAPVIALVRAMTDHIVDHGFRLIDHDGKPTRWGNWSPKYVNSMDAGWADRGLQAVEILSYLDVAYHITGDQKYADAAKMLRDKYNYDINAAYGRHVFPPDFVVPWDDTLAFVSYYGLLKNEKDPQAIKAYRASLDRNWLFVSRKNDPFYNFVYAAVFPDKNQPVSDTGVYGDFAKAVAKGIQTLREMPLSLINWKVRNTQRLDVTLDPTPRQKPAYGWSSVTKEALPVDERWPGDDAFELNRNGNGLSEGDGTDYLLPYYMGLYYGYLK